MCIKPNNGFINPKRILWEADEDCVLWEILKKAVFKEITFAISDEIYFPFTTLCWEQQTTNKK